MRASISFAAPVALLLLAACEASTTMPTDSSVPIGQASVTSPWGPESPPFNLEAVLRSPSGGAGFGLVRFRQPNDGDQIVYLDVWVRDLAPGTSYRLQRAVDGVVDGTCTSASGWLTLGAGLTPLAIDTDDRGIGRAELFRDLGAFPVGSRFDIHFRIIEDVGGGVALQSGCYEFAVTE
jgi:hypothetical protein